MDTCEILTQDISLQRPNGGKRKECSATHLVAFRWLLHAPTFKSISMQRNRQEPLGSTALWEWTREGLRTSKYLSHILSKPVHSHTQTGGHVCAFVCVCLCVFVLEGMSDQKDRDIYTRAIKRTQFSQKPVTLWIGLCLCARICIEFTVI